MKLVKSASGKTTIKMSKSEWQGIGKKAGWLSKSSTDFINQIDQDKKDKSYFNKKNTKYDNDPGVSTNYNDDPDGPKGPNSGGAAINEIDSDGEKKKKKKKKEMEILKPEQPRYWHKEK